MISINFQLGCRQGYVLAGRGFETQRDGCLAMLLWCLASHYPCNFCDNNKNRFQRIVIVFNFTIKRGQMMSSISIEEWMHSSDEERVRIHKSWDTSCGEGKEIASKVASLFSKECVYNISEVGILDHDGEWLMDAYVVAEDYDNLKDRKNVEFLGFRVTFSCAENQSA